MKNKIMKSLTKTDFEFPNQKGVYKGKVRDVYFIGDDYLVMIASDRISAFDHILPAGIPYKGQVLNQVATHFLKATEDRSEERRVGKECRSWWGQEHKKKKM